MAEWIRRWTSDLMGVLRACSIHGKGNFFLFFFYDDGGVKSSSAGKRERRRAGMSTANVGASCCLNSEYIKKENNNIS